MRSGQRRERIGLFLLLVACCCCSSDGGGGVRRTGAPRVCDVAFVCSVPIDLYYYDVTAAAAAQESAATDNHTVIILSIHCPTATRPPTCPSYTLSSPAAPPSLQSTQPAQQSSNQVRLLCLPFHLPFRSCSFSRPDNNSLKDTSE